MLLKHQVFRGSHASLNPTSALSSCSDFANKSRRPSTTGPAASRRMRFATHAPNSTSKDEAHPGDDSIPWPKAARGAQMPTPYEIFKQKKGAPYSKRRFYELVKLYHPDKTVHESAPADCPVRAMRLERYRLIVLANEILSDPVKRDAYDRWGAGWQGNPEVTPWSNPNQGGRTGWSGFNQNHSAARNATWEDWERWHFRQKNGDQKPVYFSNGSFVIVIIVFACVGAAAELSRAQQMSKQFLQQIENKHDATSKNLMQSRKDSLELPTKEHRVQQFLTARGPHASGGYGIMGPQGTPMKRLPAPNVPKGNDAQSKSSKDV